MVESMQQSSATPSLHLGFLGLWKIVACSQPYLAVASCIYSFWHSVIPTSYFIFNDFYTCINMDCSQSNKTEMIDRWIQRIANHIIRESVDSLCRDGADTPRPPYIGNACARPNATFVSLFSRLTVVLKCFCT